MTWDKLPSMARLLVLVAHPDLRLSRVNRRLLAAVRALAAESVDAASDSAHQLIVRDLYALYPDYLVDVAAEQAEAAAATSTR